LRAKRWRLLIARAIVKARSFKARNNNATWRAGKPWARRYAAKWFKSAKWTINIETIEVI